MLVLGRKVNDRIFLGDDIIIQVMEINRNWVRLGITAPKDVIIQREELRGRQEQEQLENHNAEDK